MILKMKRVRPSAQVPKYQSEGAACFDLHVVQGAQIPPGKACTLPTGWVVEIPDGHVMLVFSRSGHAFKHNVRLGNCVGVIDADYRGEIMVRLINDSIDQYFSIEAGDRVAQAMVMPVPQVQFEVTDELSETERGTSGFGSTGT